MVRVLALDASTTAIGWALGCHLKDLDVARYDQMIGVNGYLLYSGVYLPSEHCRYPRIWVERVHWLQSWIIGKIADHAVDVLVYETPSSNRNQKVTRQLGAVEWTVLDGGRRFAIPVHGINQNTIKATGISKKELERAAEYKGAPLDEKHAGDEADALGALYWYFNVRDRG